MNIVNKVTSISKYRIKPCNGHTSVDVCKLLNGGYAHIVYLQEGQRVVLVDENGLPDSDKVIAHVEASQGYSSGSNWQVSVE